MSALPVPQIIEHFNRLEAVAERDVFTVDNYIIESARFARLMYQAVQKYLMVNKEQIIKGLKFNEDREYKLERFYEWLNDGNEIDADCLNRYVDYLSCLQTEKPMTDAITGLHRTDSTGKTVKTTETLSPSTVNMYLYAAQAALDYVYNYSGGLLIVPIKGKGKKVESGHRREGYNTHEADKIREYIEKMPKGKKRDRLSALYFLFFVQGMRQKDVRFIRLSDVNLADGSLWTIPKKKQQKIRYDLHPHTVDVLRRYIKSHRRIEETEEGKTEDYLFVSQSRGGAKGASSYGKQVATNRAICQEFLEIRKALNLPPSKTLHCAKHYAVTKTARAGLSNTELSALFKNAEDNFVPYKDKIIAEEAFNKFINIMNDVVISE